MATYISLFEHLGLFSGGILKEKNYERNYQTTDGLKILITQKIQKITSSMLKRVFKNMHKRVQLYLLDSGGHFEHL